MDEDLAPPRCGLDTLMDVEYNAVDIITEGLSGPLEILIHIYCTNRGFLLSPVHVMAFVSPYTTEDDVNRYVQILRELIGELLS